MKNIKSLIFILLACYYEPLNANTIPQIEKLNSRDSRLPTILATIPVTKIVNAQRLNNFGKTAAVTTTTTKPAATNNFDKIVLESVVNTNDLIRNLLNLIDLEKIFKRLDHISVGKVLRHLFKKIFPNGVANKLTAALCETTTNENPTTTTETTPQTHKTSTTEAAPVTHSTLPLVHGSHYYHTTEKSKQIVSIEPEPIVVVNVTEGNETYDEVLSDLSDLKEDPVTDDYIEDQPESLELKKTKREIDDDINEMSLLTWLYNLLALEN